MHVCQVDVVGPSSTEPNSFLFPKSIFLHFISNRNVPLSSFIEETYVVCKMRSLRLSVSDHELKRKQSRYGLDSSSADYQILAIQRFLRLFIAGSRTFIIVCAMLTIFLNIQGPSPSLGLSYQIVCNCKWVLVFISWVLLDWRCLLYEPLFSYVLTFFFFF